MILRPIVLACFAPLLFSCSDDSASTDSGSPHELGQRDGAASDGGPGQDGAAPDGASDQGAPSPFNIRRFGGVGKDAAYAIAAEPGGGAIIAGTFSDPISYGTETLVGAGGQDIFLLALDSAGGTRWMKQAGGSGHDSATSVAVLPDGSIFVGGEFSDTATFGNGITHSAAGLTDGFVARFDKDGLAQWVQAFGADWSDATSGVAVMGERVVAVGYFGSATTFGNTSLTAVGDDDAFVVELAASDGKVKWAKGYGGRLFDAAHAVALSSRGDAFVAGEYRNAVVFGATTLPGAGEADAFVLALDAGGTELWAKSLGSTASEQATALAIDSEGRPTVVGSFGAAMTLGSTPLPHAGERDVFIAAMTTSGDFRWASAFGGKGDEQAHGVALDPQQLVVVGSFTQSLTFATTKVDALAKKDAFFASFAVSDGTPSNIWALGSIGDDAAHDVIQTGGKAKVVGRFEKRAGGVSSKGESDVFYLDGLPQNSN